MALIMGIDGRAIGAGAGVAAAVAVVVFVLAALSRAVGGVDLAQSNLTFLFYVLDLLGLIVGGAVAARRRPLAPLSHGALAALTAYVLVVVVSAAVSVAAGRGFPAVPYLIFNGFMAASAGMFGGALVNRLGRVRRGDGDDRRAPSGR